MLNKWLKVLSFIPHINLIVLIIALIKGRNELYGKKAVITVSSLFGLYVFGAITRAIADTIVHMQDLPVLYATIAFYASFYTVFTVGDWIVFGLIKPTKHKL